MIKIEAHSSPNQVAASIAKTGPNLDAAAQRGMNRGLQSAVAVAGTQYLTGPRPLKLGVRSGRLRGSIAFEVGTTSTSSQSQIIGRLGSNLKYAAFHEFGFHGVENVKAHSRVRAHSRRINYAGRPFVKPALEKSLPVIEREINSEIAKLSPSAS